MPIAKAIAMPGNEAWPLSRLTSRERRRGRSSKKSQASMPRKRGNACSVHKTSRCPCPPPTPGLSSWAHKRAKSFSSYRPLPSSLRALATIGSFFGLVRAGLCPHDSLLTFVSWSRCPQLQGDLLLQTCLLFFDLVVLFGNLVFPPLKTKQKKPERVKQRQKLHKKLSPLPSPSALR